jgi:hypothetical protein
MTDPRTLAALKILEENAGGAVAVSKTVRGGVTTSTVLAARETGKQLLVIAPTLRILEETVSDASDGESVMIAGNAACPLLEEELEEFPILRELPITLPDDCEKCIHYGLCKVTAILFRDDFSVAGISYAKIQALMISRSKVAKKVRGALQMADYVLLDEAHLLGFGSIPSVPVGPLPEVDEDYKHLKKILEKWRILLALHAEIIEEIMNASKDGAAAKHLSRHLVVPEPLSWQELLAVWSELRKLAKTGRMKPEDIFMLRDAIWILSHPWAVGHYVTEDDGQAGWIHISGSRAKGDRALSEFLQHVVPFAGHIYTSGTLIEPFEGYFTELSGKPVSRATFPDIMKAGERVTLIPDTWSLNAKGFKQKLPAIISKIIQIIEREKQPVYIVCPNAAKAAVIRDKLKDMGIEDTVVDYYRSDLSIGVARKDRVCIAVGMAEIPSNACDPLARGNTDEERWLDSRRLRQLTVDAATWQAINRVRDPEGVVDSKIYMIGVRLDRILELVKWGPNRQAVVSKIKTGVLPDGRAYRKAIFTITVDEVIEHCNVLGANIKVRHSHRRILVEMVKRIELYGEDLIKRKNDSILPIAYSRENGVKFTFYNYPSNKNEIDSNAILLYNLFVTRDDTYAQQLEKGEYARVNGYLRFDQLVDHVEGRKTAGCYVINPDDYVLWGCYDIDSHEAGDDGTEARGKVSALMEVLDVYEIPYMLEASGTPGSYHLWILVKRTGTYNAYRFMRQVASEAKVKGIEINPKQKHMQRDRYGNLVKLPLGINQKNGARSVFLDPETFEPLEGQIMVPGRVVLVDLPELTGDDKAMPKAKRVASEASDNNLDYCMIRTLAEGIPLEGSEGHEFRLAIATKAANIGKPPEEAALLFKDQPDFDYEYSLKKCREPVKYGYLPFSCDTLRAKCGNFATKWCPTCPFAAPAFRGVSSG